MGFFSAKKQIFVASTVYNLAGNEEDRMNFLKASLYGAVITGRSDTFIGETIVNNHLNGPGIKQRQFFNYAIRKDLTGLPAFTVQNSIELDPDLVKNEIAIPPTPAGLVTEVQSAYIADGDFTKFAEQYVLENHPELQNTAYTSDYDEETETIIIQYEGGATDVIPGGAYDPNKQFLVAYYFQHVPTSVEPLNVGPLVLDVTDDSNLPQTAGYTQDSLTNLTTDTFNIVTETTETRTYSNGDPTTITVTNQDFNVDYTNTEEVLSIVEFEGSQNPDSFTTTTLETTVYLYERRHIVNKVVTTVETNDLGGGVTETVTTEVDGGHLEEIWDFQVDTQTTINGKIEGDTQLFIYEIGSGNATLDALASSNLEPDLEYFPYIPVRINNRSIAEDHTLFGNNYDYLTGGLYDESRKAYSKASGGSKFADLVAEVEDNPDIGDIDYCYVSYGVALNVKENACRKYAYLFFKNLIPYQNTTGTYMAGYKAGINDYEGALATLQAWTGAQDNPADPLYNTPRPPVPSLAPPKTTTIKVQSDDPLTSSADNRITWISIDEEFFTGVGKPGAEVGDVWFDKNPAVVSWNETVGVGGSFVGAILSRLEEQRIEETYIYWQTGTNSYKRLTINGLVHRNMVYRGKSVDTTAHQALDDPDTSGFILPLHNPTVRSMSLIDSTQMATANTFLVFNSYEVVKQKWYETFLGMLLIIIIVVVASVLLGPAGAAGAQGLLGTNIAVGATLGLSGTAAIVAGAVVNALAAIAISMAITEISVEIFGEEWGAIIGAVISFAITFGMSGGFTDLSLSTMMTPQNLLAMSSAVANGYSGMVNAQIADMQDDAKRDAEEYEDAMRDISDMIRDLGGSNDLSFDPMQLTNAAGNGQETGNYIPESLDEFIHRTTMVGSDVVDITLSMVTNHSDLNLTLPEN